MAQPIEITDEKRHGQHYTPAELARFLAHKSIGSLAAQRDEVTIIDPACGDGELLLAAASAINEIEPDRRIKLIGYDIDESAVSAAKIRLASAELACDIVHGNFLEHQRTMSTGTIDLIITNPPYVRTQNLGQQSAQLLAAEFNLSGRVDLTHPFVKVAARLLRSGGVLGLLCSNRFLTTLAGENVRRAFTHDGLNVKELYDLGDTKLFKAAVLPAVIIAAKGEHADESIRFVSAYEQATEGEIGGDSLFEALDAPDSSTVLHNGKQFAVKVGTLSIPADAKSPWRLSEPGADKWLDELSQSTWKTFGDVAKIRVGIKSTADKVFLGSNWESVNPAVEKELLLPLITQSNVTPWRISDHLDMRVLYPYDLSSDKRRVLSLEKYPGAEDYLLSHEEQLRGRKYVIDGGREWYELWVPQRPALWAKPKIVFPDISEHPRFAYDTTGAAVNGNCYWISMDDIGDEDLALLMLAVANSSLGVRFYDEVCGNKLYSGKRRWITQYVKRMPLPDPSTPEAKHLIARARCLVESNMTDPEQIFHLDEEVEAAFAASFKTADTRLEAAPTPTLF